MIISKQKVTNILIYWPSSWANLHYILKRCTVVYIKKVHSGSKCHEVEFALWYSMIKYGEKIDISKVLLAKLTCKNKLQNKLKC